MVKNYKLTICYDGTRYCGWEHQPGRDSVQGRIEMVLARMCGMDPLASDFFNDDPPVDLIGAGRTDAGVHALAMTASVKLDTEKVIFSSGQKEKTVSTSEMRNYLNRYLPDDISVTEVHEASDRFHARYNAAGKTYRYMIEDGPVKSVFDRRYITCLDRPLDTELMKEASRYIIGEHDFKSFCGNSRMKKSTVRLVDSLNIERNRDRVIITVHGSGFLQNMVRIIVGTLIEVGYGRMKPDDVKTVLEARDRKKAGPTAPAKGLMLMGVDY